MCHPHNLAEGDSTCVRCNQLYDLLSLVVDMKEEVERLRSIKECERVGPNPIGPEILAAS